MSWAANPQARRAFRVRRFIESRRVYELVAWCGAKFTVAHDKLERAGYHLVRARPAYAEAGHYRPKEDR